MRDRAGAMIREARRRSGLSQAELARRAHVSQPVISAYESGRREPGMSMLTKLVEATGHTLRIDLSPDVGIVGLIGLEREIAEILGREVDVVPVRNLKPGVAESPWVRWRL